MSMDLLDNRISLFGQLRQSGLTTVESYVDAIESRWTDFESEPEDAVRAAELDVRVSLIRELADLQAEAEEAVLRREYLWSSTSRALASSAFSEPSSASWRQKPATGALFLVPDFGSPGFWEVFASRNSSSKDGALQTWEVTLASDLRTTVVHSVQEWGVFASTFGVADAAGVLSVDWRAVSGEIDVVAVLPLVPFAADGLHLAVGEVIVAPTAWSVPTSVVTRWGVESARSRRHQHV